MLVLELFSLTPLDCVQASIQLFQVMSGVLKLEHIHAGNALQLAFDRHLIAACELVDSSDQKQFLLLLRRRRLLAQLCQGIVLGI